MKDGHQHQLVAKVDQDRALRQALEIATEKAVQARAARRTKHLTRVIELEREGDMVCDDDRLKRTNRILAKSESGLVRRSNVGLTAEEIYAAELYADLCCKVVPEDELPADRYKPPSWAHADGPPPF